MQVQVRIGERTYEVRLADAIDISRPLYFDADKQPRAFHLPPAEARAFEAGGFIGDLTRGGSCRCDVLTLAPHGNGTHTECSAHIESGRPLLRDALRDTWLATTLMSVTPTVAGTDRIIDLAPVDLNGFDEAVVIRTLPNPASKLTAHYSGQNPPYVWTDTAHWLAGRGVRHLLLDLPSADREDDGGYLLAHRAFFAGREDATITEMVYVPDHVPDGPYLLNLQIAPFMLDAAPSRPLLFPLRSDTRSTAGNLR